ncbi:2-succinyl-5-enolpyruvyl-6-hydroxy-3-cyclohexene-1-carboxylic-acid synthase [Corynebacterium halotolerans]|uniref:2-succinyl-5-enolpyruvyl-6-hydroxy-3-cyclohexene-1-carboxylate synthase n=1 Tax=Corynebacterium halotolerans YIM 70093 = DSM 44683 TaxID=1121362 RepID=M1NVG7_9CORY|nr:2-succinyl-5-enolpyruvyl-6-hydroxy-3-cyclohexene-1-carboxylic-acid synthase [Corynebacterium halotolerans]AGF71475.1 2-succinyl-5-enolpyruvyl-6-hydroxy-3-cyclohexene-1-carboxylate synthase [Corynebacterium halotolerans YIM 70093 = DSM 44683]
MSYPESMNLAAAVAEQLSRHLSDVVICPGSRNSPLSLALLARGDIRVHVRLDERSAAFLALGLARVQRRHVGVVMTSGSAVANCLPAMVEACHSHTPLAVISADRPTRLIGTGASQTIHQQGIFGTYARTLQIETLDDVAALGEEFTSRRQVHVNVALDAPLVGDRLPEPPQSTTTHRAPAPGPRAADHGEVALDLGKNTIVIAGDEAWAVDGLEDVPTIAEPSAPAAYRPVHPLAAGIFRREQVSANDYVVNTRPEQVVVVGHPTLHRDVLALLVDPDLKVITLSRTDDFTDLARDTVRASRVKTTGEPTREWLKICDAASELAAEAVRETLGDDAHGFTGLHAAAAVADTLGTGDTLFLGASNPVRDASLIGLPYDGVATYSPRGAAGIDGTVSQAIGVALATQAAHAAEPRAPRTVALIGDVTFLHDIGGLLIGPDEPHPENLTIVVANDDGGGIFETLEIGAEGLRPSFERVFATPHEADIASLCAGYGVNHREATTLRELLDALLDTTEVPAGLTVIEARTTRVTRRALHEQLRGRVVL